MKTNFKPLLLTLGWIVLVGLFVTSCGDDDPKTPVSTTVLQDSINVANDLLADTEEGINDGQYSAASRTDLQTAITAAEAVAANTSVTQDEVNNAIVSLHAAMNTYRDA